MLIIFVAEWRRSSRKLVLCWNVRAVLIKYVPRLFKENNLIMPRSCVKVRQTLYVSRHYSRLLDATLDYSSLDDIYVLYVDANMS